MSLAPLLAQLGTPSPGCTKLNTTGSDSMLTHYPRIVRRVLRLLPHFLLIHGPAEAHTPQQMLCQGSRHRSSAIYNTVNRNSSRLVRIPPKIQDPSSIIRLTSPVVALAPSPRLPALEHHRSPRRLLSISQTRFKTPAQLEIHNSLFKTQPCRGGSVIPPPGCTS